MTRVRATTSEHDCPWRTEALGLRDALRKVESRAAELERKVQAFARLIDGRNPEAGRAAKVQPPPVPSSDAPSVWDEVIADIGEGMTRMPVLRPALEAVVADMRERDALGRARYGTPLQPGNGRNALVDAYQEQLDTCAYLRQALLEKPDPKVRACYAEALAQVLYLSELAAPVAK